MGLGSRAKRGILLGFVLLEAALLVNVWRTSGGYPTHGYLIKSGPNYVLAWHTEENYFETHQYKSLGEALKFAREELKLHEGVNPYWNDSLEYVSLEERFGSYVLLWKTLQLSYLHHLTFDDRADASFFVSAFRKGHYSPSPFGHSVVLTSLATN